MKTILVDAVHCLVSDGIVFEEMLALLESYPNPKVVLTMAPLERYEEFGLDKVNYEVFTTELNPKKNDPEYYKQFFEKFGLTATDVVYFEHNEEACAVAESLGITTHFYDSGQKDLVALKQFLDENL